MDEKIFVFFLEMVKEVVEKGKSFLEKIFGVLWVYIGGVIFFEFF